MFFETSAIQGKLLKKVVIVAGLAVLFMTAYNLALQIRLNRRKVSELG